MLQNIPYTSVTHCFSQNIMKKDEKRTCFQKGKHWINLEQGKSNCPWIWGTQESCTAPFW